MEAAASTPCPGCRLSRRAMYPRACPWPCTQMSLKSGLRYRGDRAGPLAVFHSRHTCPGHPPHPQPWVAVPRPEKGPLEKDSRGQLAC